MAHFETESEFQSKEGLYTKEDIRGVRTEGSDVRKLGRGEAPSADTEEAYS